MKKILIVIPLLMSAVFAQNPNTKNSDLEKKSGVADQPAANALDGKAYKVTYKVVTDDKDLLTSPDQQNKEGVLNKNTKGESVPEKDKNKSSGYSVADQPLANTHALLKFENGTVKSSSLDKQNMNDCAYHITASGEEELYSFTSFCMNTTAPVNKPDGVVQKEKSEIVLTPDNTILSPEIGEPKVDRRPGDSKPYQPATGINENQANRMNQQAVSGSSASISGVINGNSITGTLVCWMENGKSVKYSFTGSRASAKEIRSEENRSSKGIQ